ncbi:uncharacterized protein LOC143447391 [Clavelina lepadiformis]|uniref:uncharacterized protein LOC143447391 n=1 Tax=Clavelina lepadiformis TaxID=159417 RepID=UPI00404356A8
MALSRRRLTSCAAAKTSISLGHYQGPNYSTYHEGFVLGWPAAHKVKATRFEHNPVAENRREIS